MEVFDYENTSKDDVKLKLAQDSIYSTPIFKETTNKKWVNFVDNDKNQYPDRLIYYANNCALHGAIVRSITKLFAGNGFIYDTSTSKSKATAEFLESIDSPELLYRISNDLKIFGGISLAIVWSKDYSKIINVEHVDFSKLRAHVVDEKTGKIPGYFYSWSWNTQRPNAIFIPSFSEDAAKEQQKKYQSLKDDLDANNNLKNLEDFFKEPTTQLFYYKPYSPNTFYYPYPDYVQAINAIRTDILADQYGVNSMENGLSVDYIIKFYGIYDDAAKKRESQAIIKQIANPARKKYPLITFSSDKDHQMEIENISGERIDLIYTKINENAALKILQAHSIPSPLLVGVKMPGQLGGSSEIEQSRDAFYDDVIRTGQLQICKVMNKIMKINNLELVDIEKVNRFSSSKPNNETNN